MKTKGLWCVALEKVLALVICGCLVGACAGPAQEKEARPVQVPTSSMEPTIKRGSEVMVRPWSAKEGGAPLKRFDIVLIRSPENQETFLARRIVGLPGEIVDFSPPATSGLLINGRKLESVPESMNDIQFQMNSANPDENTRTVRYPYQLMTETYYLLGDNPAASRDSRFWGGVKVGQIVGIVETKGK